MQLSSYFPSDILKPYVRVYNIVESRDGMENSILPDTSLVMAFRYKGSVNYGSREEEQSRLPVSVITGIRESVRLLQYAPDTANLLVIFSATGAAAFFKVPLHELAGTSLPLDTLLPDALVRETEEQLAAAADHVQRIAIVERLLCTLLQAPGQDALVLHAVRAITAARGIVKIKALAGNLHISQDAFEKRFRRLAGVSPKQFASIVRFRNVVAQVPQSASLTDVALNAGYFDQAHFIRDFRAFTGLAPQEFFKSVNFW
ncbi:helix-turn-helix domain-containing protein [Chitinophaga japonensis]|nr:helix-turn-helix domain-containing protein [Chitinophaga japonensis]